MTTGTRPLTGVELLDEVQWLIDNGTHPLLVAQLLSRSPGSIAKAARKAGRGRLAVPFERTHNEWLGWGLHDPRSG